MYPFGIGISTVHALFLPYDRGINPLAAAAYKAAFNTADTRTWELLPREFQIAEIPLPPDRTLTIAPNGTAPVTVTVPPQAGSAILYVCAPAAPPAPWKYRLFELP